MARAKALGQEAGHLLGMVRRSKVASVVGSEMGSGGRRFRKEEVPAMETSRGTLL